MAAEGSDDLLKSISSKIAPWDGRDQRKFQAWNVRVLGRLDKADLLGWIAALTPAAEREKLVSLHAHDPLVLVHHEAALREYDRAYSKAQRDVYAIVTTDLDLAKNDELTTKIAEEYAPDALTGTPGRGIDLYRLLVTRGSRDDPTSQAVIERRVEAFKLDFSLSTKRKTESLRLWLSDMRALSYNKHLPTSALVNKIFTMLNAGGGDYVSTTLVMRQAFLRDPTIYDDIESFLHDIEACVFLEVDKLRATQGGGDIAAIDERGRRIGDRDRTRTPAGS